MGAKTEISWTDATWNPVRGCSRISPGCLNCYAEKIASRFSGDGLPFQLFADKTKSGSKWTGKVEQIEEHLDDPRKWKQPRKIFVNSMSDLFHENLKWGSIEEVFDVMSECPQHTFQILTKRADKMQKFVSNYVFHHGDEPLPNVWLGVSVENQQYADERLIELMLTPAAVRFVSYEPALGPVDFKGFLQPSLLPGRHVKLAPLNNWIVDADGAHVMWRGLDWVIVGGESGPGARPFFVQHAQDTVRQCRDAKVACFVKQMGSVPIVNASRLRHYEWGEGNFEHWKSEDSGLWRVKLKDRKGADPSEWHKYLRVQEFPTLRSAS